MAMKKIGEVTAILNNIYFLARADKDLKAGQQIAVYQEIGLTKTNQKKTGLKKITVPKGSYKVVSPQDNNIYLISFVETKTITTYKNDLAASLYGLSNVFGKTEEIESKAEEDKSARLDEEKSLSLKINPKVQVGDSISQI